MYLITVIEKCLKIGTIINVCNLLTYNMQIYIIPKWKGLETMKDTESLNAFEGKEIETV